MNLVRRLIYKQVNPALGYVDILVHCAVTSHDQRVAVAPDNGYVRKPLRSSPDSAKDLNRGAALSQPALLNTRHT